MLSVSPPGNKFFTLHYLWSVTDSLHSCRCIDVKMFEVTNSRVKAKQQRLGCKQIHRVALTSALCFGQMCLLQLLLLPCSVLLEEDTPPSFLGLWSMCENDKDFGAYICWLWLMTSTWQVHGRKHCQVTLRLTHSSYILHYLSPKLENVIWPLKTRIFIFWSKQIRVWHSWKFWYEWMYEYICINKITQMNIRIYSY